MDKGSGPKVRYDPSEILLVLAAVWLVGDPLCGKLFKLRPAPVHHPRKGLSATRPGMLLRRTLPTRPGPPDSSRPGSVEAATVAHCDDSTAGDYVNSLTFTELYSG